MAMLNERSPMIPHEEGHPLHRVENMQGAVMPFAIDLMYHISGLLNLEYHKRRLAGTRPLIVSINRAAYGKPSMGILEWQGTGPWMRIVIDLYHPAEHGYEKFLWVDGKDMSRRAGAVAAAEVIKKYLRKVGLLETHDWTKGDELTFAVGCFRNGMFDARQLCEFIQKKKTIDQLLDESDKQADACLQLNGFESPLDVSSDEVQ